mmetsp:Transcript_27132/g.60011  ORF Transcript_27132/g.60011 Transcript_27132/m.60011 type:complete len:454 (-) Transcript_27132:1440-2801(-)
MARPSTPAYAKSPDFSITPPLHSLSPPFLLSLPEPEPETGQEPEPEMRGETSTLGQSALAGSREGGRRSSTSSAPAELLRMLAGCCAAPSISRAPAPTPTPPAPVPAPLPASVPPVLVPAPELELLASTQGAGTPSGTWAPDADLEVGAVKPRASLPLSKSSARTALGDVMSSRESKSRGGARSLLALELTSREPKGPDVEGLRGRCRLALELALEFVGLLLLLRRVRNTSVRTSALNSRSPEDPEGLAESLGDRAVTIVPRTGIFLGLSSFVSGRFVGEGEVEGEGEAEGESSRGEEDWDRDGDFFFEPLRGMALGVSTALLSPLSALLGADSEKSTSSSSASIRPDREPSAFMGMIERSLLFSCSLAGVVFFTLKRPSRLKGRQRPDCSSARTPPVLGERAWGELGESIAEGLLFPGESLDTDTEDTRPPSLPRGLQLEASWGGRLALLHR